MAFLFDFKKCFSVFLSQEAVGVGFFVWPEDEFGFCVHNGVSDDVAEDAGDLVDSVCPIFFEGDNGGG